MKRDVFKRPLERNSGGKTRRERPSGDTVAVDPVKTIRRREAAAAGSASRSEGGRATRIAESGGLDDRATLMALPVAVYRTDPDGRIAFFNRAAAELWGHEPAAGSLWCGALRRYRPDGGPMEAGESPTRVAIRDGIALRGIETSIERPDGTRVAVLDQSTPIRDAAGRILGAITVMEAAAGRGSAVDEAQRLAAIVEGSDDAIISKTLGGIVTSWNPGAERIFGHSAQEMVGQPIARIIPEDLQEEERQILAKLARGERIDHFDTVRLSRDGRRIAISLTVSPLRDAAGAIVGASKIARDVTERKQAEDALRQATEAARQAQIEAESANRAKTEFLAVMSHEIRTPLNSISGFIDLLTSTTELTPKQRRYARLVKSANAALLTVVNDILDFSKVEAGQLELDRHVSRPRISSRTRWRSWSRPPRRIIWRLPPPSIPRRRNGSSATMRACVRSCSTCSTTRSSSRRRGRSGSMCVPRSPRATDASVSASPSPTPASASRPSSSNGCSRNSPRPTVRSTGGTADPASASPSASVWSN